MPIYRCSGTVIGSTYIGEIEADNSTEALKKATDLAHVSFCHQCASGCEDPEITEIVLRRRKAVRVR